MLYLYLENRQIKILSTKKALLGQQEVSFFNKRLEVDLLAEGKVTNVDFLASAVKEGLTSLGVNHDRNIFLILPQESFSFLKADVPTDIATSAVKSFVYDKARSSLKIDIENCFCDYYVRESENQKHISFFAIEHSLLEKYLEALSLLHLKLISVLPETLAFFKLFEKTLRKEKKENMLYAYYEKGLVSGYLFDSIGLVHEKKWMEKLESDNSIEKVLKTKIQEYDKEGIKLNRIILSGPESESIRQDTFTKNVGAWTNPLKRIIPNFYEDYVKQLITPSKQTFPILLYDVCFGAFIFSQENKEFQILKKPLKSLSKSGLAMPKLAINKKDITIFLFSLVVSFLVFFGVSKMINSDFKLNFSLPKFEKEKPTPTPKKAEEPTPEPKVDKEKLRIKVLNGSGTAGRASEVKSLLSEKGYQEILTGNAASFDYKTTVIQAKKDAQDAVAVLKKDLEDSVKSPKVETLKDDETADVIIIIGSDFK